MARAATTRSRGRLTSCRSSVLPPITLASLQLYPIKSAAGMSPPEWEVDPFGWVSERAARWFSELLETACSLVYMPDSTVRPADPAFAPEETRVSFADAFPFLLISEESLADLNLLLAAPIPMNRFRPNLVMRGCEPYGEDRLDRFRIGPIRFRGSSPVPAAPFRPSIRPPASAGRSRCAPSRPIAVGKARCSSGRTSFITTPAASR